MKSKSQIHSPLIAWFALHQRVLPWREIRTPYRSWISEIMLQQTQVDTVVPYFLRWMEKYPDVETLSRASEEEIVKMWEGLGYYSRAKNILRSAKMIMERWGGRFPENYDDILSLPGIGEYTAGAILSIAMKKPYPIVDGNVMRVYSRLLRDDTDISSTAGKKHFWKIAEKYLDREKPHLYNEALMELGALVCTPANPKCAVCPWHDICVARRDKKQSLYPVKNKKNDCQKLNKIAWIIRKEDLKKGSMIWIQKTPMGQARGGLWEFPTEDVTGQSTVRNPDAPRGGFKTRPYRGDATYLCRVQHSYTKYRVTLDAYCVEIPMDGSDGVAAQRAVPLQACIDKQNGKWVVLDELKNYTFSSGARKVLKYLQRINPSPTLPLTREGAVSPLSKGD
ncbi:MAG: A/G-specific adenine glycosylase [Parcubacteria group bacterium Gr01-1014_18]|nr:MAG: A/G-specific adenine glycosylase [Parcubacteria group bacterium Greene0416_36]TSC81466.1 MAG: A/G-specific adenine glycosylase [Parcubacteria group bacterium Gr01-1014_18]TSC99064.1 MAG: A/G-specific adenine glycosylase [Parcubacteria group bacterium Greene1014_20]TSD07255.1 MAG: A/G-specific adenine glycosylase [Parcubacteria group bacterium Greene0714_2]